MKVTQNQRERPISSGPVRSLRRCDNEAPLTRIIASVDLALKHR